MGRAFVEGSSAPLAASLLRWLLSGLVCLYAGNRHCPEPLGSPVGLQARRSLPGLPAAEDGELGSLAPPPPQTSAVAILCCERARRQLLMLGCGVARFRLVTRGEGRDAGAAGCYWTRPCGGRGRLRLPFSAIA